MTCWSQEETNDLPKEGTSRTREEKLQLLQEEWIASIVNVRESLWQLMTPDEIGGSERLFEEFERRSVEFEVLQVTMDEFSVIFALIATMLSDDRWPHGNAVAVRARRRITTVGQRLIKQHKCTKPRERW